MNVPFAQAARLLSASAKASAESDNMSVIILITGFVVVFMILLLLIGIIKIYSGIVYAFQQKSERKKAAKAAEVSKPSEVLTEVVQESADDDALDLQTVAVITAAVEAFYSKDKKVRVTSIRPANKSRSEWASAGLAQNIPAMRSEGLL